MIASLSQRAEGRPPDHVAWTGGIMTRLFFC
jgi:hypothetical protein